MSDTIEGGAYLGADGKTWHDANGQPLSDAKVREAKKFAGIQEKELADIEEQIEEQAPAVVVSQTTPKAK